jgi:hypothetical protein
LFLNPRVTQVFLGTLLGLSLLAMAAAFYQWYATGVPDLLLFLRVGLVLLGLLVLYNVAAARPGPATHGSQCARCGSQTFETIRSLDRLAVTTCFRCGAESLAQNRGRPGTSV